MASVVIGEFFSAWTEKALFAIDHHRLPYRYIEHIPLVGEPLLRLRLNEYRERVSVPAWIVDGQTFRDSFTIAKEADRRGTAEKLFPAPLTDEIAAWNARSERALQAGRARVIVRMTEVPDADLEALPPFFPKFASPILRQSTRLALRFLAHKYALTGDLEASNAIVRAELLELRRALDGRPYLYGALTYADITMAVVLQLVSPVANEFIPLGPATRTVWTNELLADEFSDLVEWRDALYRKYRPTKKL